MSSGSHDVLGKFMTPFGEAQWNCDLDLDSGTYTSSVFAIGRTYEKWGSHFFKSYLYLNESSLRNVYGDFWVKIEIPDEKWAPAQPENETSRNFGQKEEPMDDDSSMCLGLGIAAATGFSLALCI